jgi:GNAT superfamily N-acetyltransferase
MDVAAAPTTTPLVRSEHRTASEILARAFADDPMYRFLLPDERIHKAQLGWLMGLMVRYGQMYGLATRPADRLTGAAVWMPPGSGDATPWRMLRAGAAAGLWRMGPSHLKRMVDVSDYLERLRQERMPEPHHYLMLIGVDPSSQGQGIGSVLLAPELAKADHGGHASYLETTKERNLPFYQRHGFVIVDSGTVPKGGPAFWTMRRPAGSGPAVRA